MKRFITALTAIAMLSSTATAITSSAVSYAPAKVSGISSTYDNSSVTLSWSKVSGAEGYRVYKYNSTTKKWKSLKTTKKLTFTDSGLNSSSVHKYKVKAYSRNSKKAAVWGKASDTYRTATAPESVSFSPLSKTYDSIRLTWNDVDCTGYQIFQKNSSGKWDKLTTLKNETKATTYKVIGLKESTKYSFKVRPYYSYNGKVYIAKSTAINGTTKENCPEWTAVDKAYYNMCLGYPSNKDIELVSEDISNYIVNKYSDKYNITRDTSLWRLFGFGTENVGSYNFEKHRIVDGSEISGADKTDDAHLDHYVCFEVGGGLIPLKNGYNKQNYEEVQWYKNECYEWIGDASIELLEKQGSGLVYCSHGFEYQLNINVAIACIYDGQVYFDEGDYYNDKDPWNIPEYIAYFAHDFVEI